MGLGAGGASPGIEGQPPDGGAAEQLARGHEAWQVPSGLPHQHHSFSFHGSLGLGGPPLSRCSDGGTKAPRPHRQARVRLKGSGTCPRGGSPCSPCRPPGRSTSSSALGTPWGVRPAYTRQCDSRHGPGPQGGLGFQVGARCCAAGVVGGALGPRMTGFCSPSVPDPPSPLRLWSPLPIKHTVWEPHMPPARLLLGVGGAVRGRANIYGALTVGLQVATVPTSHSWGHWGWGIPAGPRACLQGLKALPPVVWPPAVPGTRLVPSLFSKFFFSDYKIIPVGGRTLVK